MPIDCRFSVNEVVPKANLLTLDDWRSFQELISIKLMGGAEAPDYYSLVRTVGSPIRVLKELANLSKKDFFGHSKAITVTF